MSNQRYFKEMKTIGLIGGITPESTILYYRVFNELAASHYGMGHTAKIVINSVDFAKISKLQQEGRWDVLGEIMRDAGKSLEKAGASFIIICANTMHLTIQDIQNAVSIPVVHIAEATAEQIVTKNIHRVALLGTKYTMEKAFYKDILINHAIETVIPNESDRKFIHDVIYNELAHGVIKKTSKERYLTIIDRLRNESNIEGVVLGCTEIPLLLKQEDVNIPVFDTTAIHAKKVFDLSII